ncbi:MAG: hypothetical protein M3067_06205 [Chloroflexota bacterium]|nr:hypothetical protein [Chloroflexota bacterium]
MERRGPSLSQQAAWADRNDERIAQHRAEAELAAEMDRTEDGDAARLGPPPGFLGRLISRVRIRLGR